MVKTENNYSEIAKEILKILKLRKNVLISGPPACGKSRLLNELASAFTQEYHVPMVNPTSPVLIPRESGVASTFNDNNFPAFSATNRQVYRTVFHQNTKHREFVTGYAPKNGELGFNIVKGTLYRASEFAKQHSSAALLIIDEINRGPAVQIFGGSIVGIEPEKRLDENNALTIDTQLFEVIDPISGDIIEYALPNNLYIVAAMNQADTSVEPLDIAFLRRWAPFELAPDYTVLNEILEITSSGTIDFNTPLDTSMLYEVSILAFHKINTRISIGKSKEFQIGHGVYLTSREDYSSKSLNEALDYICNIFEYIFAHVKEVFFNDLHSISIVFNASNDLKDPIHILEVDFGEDTTEQLIIPKLTSQNIYKILLQIIGE